MPSPQNVCLNMIVKDEARVIARCIASVRPLITSWVIVDTGSTDGTQDLIRELLGDLPGELHERPWVDFGHNRTEALQLARGKADYVFIMDADEVVEIEPGFTMPRLTRDAYRTKHYAGTGGTSFFLPQLLRCDMPFRYEGVLHEHVACDVGHETVDLVGFACRGLFDGARNVDPIAKYRNDARVLERALVTDPDNARYVFYLAQSYRDAGMRRESIQAYERRATMGGWDEETWYSLFQVARMREHEGEPLDAVTYAFLRAYDARPQRAEPLVDLARSHRLAGHYAVAHLFAERAARIPRPADTLFLDESTYAWRAVDELSISAYYLGDFAGSEQLCRVLLDQADLPDEERARVTENLEFALRQRGS